MPTDEKCALVKNEKELTRILKEERSVFVLFYASWCAFSRKFLPEFIENAGRSDLPHVRVLVDDNEALAEKYSVEVYPTIIYFQNGELARRLDGEPMRGLHKAQLKDFVGSCSVKKKK